jgi:sugar phosphate permease
VQAIKPSRVRYGVTTFAITLAILAYIQRVAISQATVPMQADLGLSKAQMGMIFGAFGLSYALFEIPSGVLGDKFGPRSVLIRIVLAWSAFTALTGAAWNFVSLWVIRFLFGAGEAGCFPNLTRMLGIWLPGKTRIRAQALMWACSRWGGAVTPPLALIAIQLLGWRWAFPAFALLGIAWVIPYYRWYRDDPAQHKSVNAAELALLSESRSLTSREGEADWRRTLLQPRVALLLLQYFCFSFVWIFYITWLPTYLKEARGLSATQAAGLATLPLLFGGFGSLIGGFLASRFSKRGVAVFGFLASAALISMVTRIESPVAAMIAMGIASFCSDLTMPISWNACVEIGRRNTATLSGAMNMFGNLASFVAPVVGGLILERSGGNWTILINMMVVSSALAGLCWLFLNPEQKVVIKA